MKDKLKSALESKVVVFDGAMGDGDLSKKNYFVATSMRISC